MIETINRTCRKVIFWDLDMTLFDTSITYGMLWKEAQQYIPQYALYNNVYETLQELANRGVEQWIVSGNVESTIRKVIAHFHLPILTDHLSGYKYGMTRDHYKRKVAVIGNALKRIQSDAEVIYIGDEATDVEACKHLGVQCLFATWGSREREAAQHLDVSTLDDPTEVLNLIAGA